ncbi:hypothetical protein DNTS_004884 [Danionella cerebrum]|uniref:Uncharacterized protein n=1 Tax=Danionella cerebrum TaxID=2873325 RepID=A0A553MQJ2_9TELE|nr:hypothetical protein DNTS_004884 [Danionella translucida]
MGGPCAHVFVGYIMSLLLLMVEMTELRVVELPAGMSEWVSVRQEALLAAISEKDANIALLELSSSKKKKTQDEVALLKREKDRLVHQLKQQFKERVKPRLVVSKVPEFRDPKQATDAQPQTHQEDLWRAEGGWMVALAQGKSMRIRVDRDRCA